MTCGDAREYLFSFLDSELDAPLSIELQRHLDGCPQCAREAEIERTIRKRLEHAMEAAAVEIPALAGAGRVLALRAGVSTLIQRRPLLAAAAILTLVVGAGLWFGLRVPTGGQAASGTRGRARFADLLVADFDHFLDDGGSVKIASEQHETVADWLRGQTALAVVLPVSKDPRCRLIGGRKCKIDGRPAAFAVYDMNGVSASLVAMATEHVDLGDMKEVRRGGVTYWVDHCKGYTIVARRRGNLMYAAVSTLLEDQLLCLVTDAAHESD